MAFFLRRNKSSSLSLSLSLFTESQNLICFDMFHQFRPKMQKERRKTKKSPVAQDPQKITSPKYHRDPYVEYLNFSQICPCPIFGMNLCLVNSTHTTITSTHTRGTRTIFRVFMWRTHLGRVRTPLGRMHMLTQSGLGCWALV